MTTRAVHEIATTTYLPGALLELTAELQESEVSMRFELTRENWPQGDVLEWEIEWRDGVKVDEIVQGGTHRDKQGAVKKTDSFTFRPPPGVTHATMKIKFLQVCRTAVLIEAGRG